MDIEQLKAYCERKGYHSRADRFKVIFEILNILPEEAKEVEKITRYFRELFPIDEVGKAKEAEWHKPISQIIYEKEQQKILNSKLF